MKCKPIEPGCLAMIVGSKLNPENNGRVVRVVRRAERSELPTELTRVRIREHPEWDYSGVSWWVEVLPDHPPLKYSLIIILQERTRKWDVRARGYLQKYLIRIDGDPADVQEQKKEVTKPREDVY